ncbi:MAG: alpha/beta hydrolase-fold protein [Gammaproteobacteria bacterium]
MCPNIDLEPLTFLPAVTIDPIAPVTASVICLHGLGADGHDLESVVAELGLPQRHGVRFLLPHAPHRPVTINNGYVMRAWYDIVANDLSQREDSVGVGNSERLLHRLIEREIDSGIPPHRIVLAGFSQGGAIALHTGLRYPQRLAGVLALSSYLPLAGKVAEEAHFANAGLPILMAHGIHDSIVPMASALASRSLLERLGYSVDWLTYPMGHESCAQEMKDINQWLMRILG